MSDLSWPVPMVLLAALGLGLLTEGLQLVAIGRDANWRDVGIDVLGACLGGLLTMKMFLYGINFLLIDIV